MQKIPKKTAFSIVELSIVVVIVSILVGTIVAANKISDNAKLATAQSLTKSSPVNDIDGLSLWLETTMPQSIAEAEADDGKTVTTWFDLSVNKIDFSGSVTYKTNSLGGLPSLSFNGSQNLTRTNIGISNFVQANQGTIFLVQRYISGAGSTIFLEVPGNRINVHALHSGNLHFDFGTCCGANARTTTTPLNFANKDRVISLVKSPSKSTITIDGFTAATNSSATGTLTNATLSTFYVGVNASPGYFIGNIGEVIIFNRGLSDKERKDVEQYLGKKWGITLS